MGTFEKWGGGAVQRTGRSERRKQAAERDSDERDKHHSPLPAPRSSLMHSLQVKAHSLACLHELAQAMPGHGNRAHKRRGLGPAEG